MPVPKLRFKDERGQEYPKWKSVLFSDITYLSAEKNKKDLAYPTYSISNSGGFVSREEQFNQGALQYADKTMYRIVEPKSFAYNPARINVGSIGYQNLPSPVIVSSLYIVFKTTHDVNDMFIWQWFHSPLLFKAIKKYAEGGVRSYFFYDKLCSTRCRLPSLPEQEKIADFLSSYDRMIDVQAKRVEAMKTRKKGLLQKIFSQELRFKDERGQEYPEWSTCKIEDLCYMKGRIGWQGLKAKDFIEEGPYCVTGTDFIDGKVNWKTCYHVSQLRYEMDSNIQLRDGDLLITKDGTIGKLAYIEKLPGEACLNSHLLVIRPSVNKLTNKFLYQVFSSNLFVEYYLRAGSGSTMKSLSQSVIGKFMCPLPSIPEQEKIADFLSAVDTQIEVEKKRLETMKTIKKGLLQQMFF